MSEKDYDVGQCTARSISLFQQISQCTARSMVFMTVSSTISFEPINEIHGNLKRHFTDCQKGGEEFLGNLKCRFIEITSPEKTNGVIHWIHYAHI